MDLEKMMVRKSDVVKTLTGGVKMLLKRNKVTMLTGRGKLTAEKTIKITGKDAGKRLS